LGWYDIVVDLVVLFWEITIVWERNAKCESLWNNTTDFRSN